MPGRDKSQLLDAIAALSQPENHVVADYGEFYRDKVREYCKIYDESCGLRDTDLDKKVSELWKILENFENSSLSSIVTEQDTDPSGANDLDGVIDSLRSLTDADGKTDKSVTFNSKINDAIAKIQLIQELNELAKQISLQPASETTPSDHFYNREFAKIISSPGSAASLLKQNTTQNLLHEQVQTVYADLLQKSLFRLSKMSEAFQNNNTDNELIAYVAALCNFVKLDIVVTDVSEESQILNSALRYKFWVDLAYQATLQQDFITAATIFPSLQSENLSLFKSMISDETKLRLNQLNSVLNTKPDGFDVNHLHLSRADNKLPTLRNAYAKWKITWRNAVSPTAAVTFVVPTDPIYQSIMNQNDQTASVGENKKSLTDRGRKAAKGIKKIFTKQSDKLLDSGNKGKNKKDKKDKKTEKAKKSEIKNRTKENSKLLKKFEFYDKEVLEPNTNASSEENTAHKANMPDVIVGTNITGKDASQAANAVGDTASAPPSAPPPPQVSFLHSSQSKNKQLAAVRPKNSELQDAFKKLRHATKQNLPALHIESQKDALTAAIKKDAEKRNLNYQIKEINRLLELEISLTKLSQHFRRDRFAGNDEVGNDHDETLSIIDSVNLKAIAEKLQAVVAGDKDKANIEPTKNAEILNAERKKIIAWDKANNFSKNAAQYLAKVTNKLQEIGDYDGYHARGDTLTVEELSAAIEQLTKDRQFYTEKSSELRNVSSEPIIIRKTFENLQHVANLLVDSGKRLLTLNDYSYQLDTFNKALKDADNIFSLMDSQVKNKLETTNARLKDYEKQLHPKQQQSSASVSETSKNGVATPDSKIDISVSDEAQSGELFDAIFQDTGFGLFGGVADENDGEQDEDGQVEVTTKDSNDADASTAPSEEKTTTTRVNARLREITATFNELNDFLNGKVDATPQSTCATTSTTAVVEDNDDGNDNVSPRIGASSSAQSESSSSPLFGSNNDPDAKSQGASVGSSSSTSVSSGNDVPVTVSPSQTGYGLFSSSLPRSSSALNSDSDLALELDDNGDTTALDAPKGGQSTNNDRDDDSKLSEADDDASTSESEIKNSVKELPDDLSPPVKTAASNYKPLSFDALKTEYQSKFIDTVAISSAQTLAIQPTSTAPNLNIDSVQRKITLKSSEVKEQKVQFELLNTKNSNVRINFVFDSVFTILATRTLSLAASKAKPVVIRGKNIGMVAASCALLKILGFKYDCQSKFNQEQTQTFNVKLTQCEKFYTDSTLEWNGKQKNMQQYLANLNQSQQQVPRDPVASSVANQLRAAHTSTTQSSPELGARCNERLDDTSAATTHLSTSDFVH